LASEEVARACDNQFAAGSLHGLDFSFLTVEANMTGVEIEKVVEPIIRTCLLEFGDFTPRDVNEAEFDAATEGLFRPDTRRISLIISLTQSFLGPVTNGEGLEVGCGYGYLLFPLSVLIPRIRWTGVEHPDRRFFHREDFVKAINAHNCELRAANITSQPLPFSDRQFSVVTFSETLEHIPPERLNFVLSEIARVVCVGGILIVTSPNQASLENRIRLLRGKSILEMPNEVPTAKGTFGHIRVYIPSEVESAMSTLGFALERCIFESNNSGYRGTSPRSFQRRLYRLYERVEGRLKILRSLGDTWYMVFRKKTASSDGN
jgi:SAM-dependent methyltransferase